MGRSKEKNSKSKVSQEIRDKFIEYFKNNEHLKLVFKDRGRMCPDANDNSFEEFINNYWWKKLSNYISGKFGRDIKDVWKGVSKDKFFAWYLNKEGMLLL